MSAGLTAKSGHPGALVRARADLGTLSAAALRLTQLVYLAVLWTVACLPIVTIPAAFVALVARIRAWRVSGQEPSARAMVAEMTTAFTRRSVVLAVVAGGFIVLALDLRAVSLMSVAARPVALMGWFAVTICVAMLTVHVPAVLAATESGCVEALRRSAVAAVRRPMTALVGVGAVATAAVVVISVPVSAPLLALATAWALDRLFAGMAGAATEERHDIS